MNSFELLKLLKKHYTPKFDYWWPDVGKFEVVIGVILTQRTKWENVQNALDTLRFLDLLELDKIVCLDDDTLKDIIKKCGFYNQKAKNLKLLCKNILNDFGDFESFKQDVSRKWLLNQKGIGFESADSILNYGCKKEAFVVDNYLYKILCDLNYCLESYEEMQEWILRDLNDKMLYTLYPKNMPKSQIYARFHGKIVMCGQDKNKILKNVI